VNHAVQDFLIQKNLAEGDNEHFNINDLNNQQDICGDDHPPEKIKQSLVGCKPSRYRISDIISFSLENHSYRNALLIGCTAWPCIFFIRRKKK